VTERVVYAQYVKLKLSLSSFSNFSHMCTLIAYANILRAFKLNFESLLPKLSSNTSLPKEAYNPE